MPHRRLGFAIAVLPLALLLADAGVAGELDTRSMIQALRLPTAAPEAASRNLVVVARDVSATVATAASPASPASSTTAAAPPPSEPPSLSLVLPFGANSAQLRPESGQVLGQLVAALLSPELRQQRFLIEGHADGRGHAAANQRLSLERAEEVRQYLVALGVPAGRLRAAGRGARDLANPADPAAAENRRVRVVALP
jgi:outer membrane protein OmpA-like peptidoglycan-associated protein